MSTNGHYQDHKLAAILPLMEEAELRQLADDISHNGLRAPITLYENKILDGRNRYRACAMVNVEPKIRHFTAGDPVAFIVSANVHRRHLTESQRAMVAAKIESMKPGRAPAKDANLHVSKTRAEAAKELNVSPRSVATAKQVLREAPKKDIAAIEHGEKTVSGVAKEIRAAKAAPAQETDKLGRAIPADLVGEWKRAEQVGKKLQSLAREIKSIVSEGFAGPKQDKLNDVIYAEVGNSIISDAAALGYSLGSIIPHALCPSCQGRTRKTCALCRKRGWISKFLWNSPAVNEETRKMIEGSQS